MQNHLSSQVDTILRPNYFDILCGSGKTVSAHPGNRRFQAIVEKRYPSYTAAFSKRAKMEVTHEVLAEIMASGCTRFLKKDPIYDRYYVAASRVGKDKVSHCLRVMKLGKSRQNRRKQSPPGDQQHADNGAGIHAPKTMHNKEEHCSILHQRSIQDVLRGGMEASMGPATIVSDIIVLSHDHPTIDILEIGTLMSNTSSSDTTTSTASPAVPSEPVSRWWQTGDQFPLRGGDHSQERGPPAESAPCGMYEMLPAPGPHSGGIELSKLFWDQPQEADDDMSDNDLLCQQSFDAAAALRFNVLENEQQHLATISDEEEDIYNSILDTLVYGHQERTEDLSVAGGFW